MKIQCTLDDFSECWVEVSEKWTRPEEIELYTANTEQGIALWQRKVVACNLRLETGEYITQPQAMTAEAINQMDLRLAGFVGGILDVARLELRNLGKVSRRVSLNGFAPGK